MCGIPFHVHLLAGPVVRTVGDQPDDRCRDGREARPRHVTKQQYLVSELGAHLHAARPRAARANAHGVGRVKPTTRRAVARGEEHEPIGVGDAAGDLLDSPGRELPCALKTPHAHRRALGRRVGLRVDHPHRHLAVIRRGDGGAEAAAREQARGGGGGRVGGRVGQSCVGTLQDQPRAALQCRQGEREDLQGMVHTW